MKPKQLQARGGEVYKHRLDPLTIINMRTISELLERKLGLRPSQTVLIRRALRHYGAFIQEEFMKARTISELNAEKARLMEAAGRD